MALKRRTSVRPRKAAGRPVRPARGLSRLWAIAVILAAGAAAGIVYNLLSPKGLFKPAPVPPPALQEAAKPKPILPKPKPKPKPVVVTTEEIKTAPAPSAEPQAVESAPEPAPTSTTVLETVAPVETGACKVLSLEDAHGYFQKGSAIFVDARSAQSYSLGHIPRAINLPASDFEAAFARNEKSLPREATIIVYCQSESCDQASHVCEQLAGRGYSNLMHFARGWITWQYSGLPRE